MKTLIKIDRDSIKLNPEGGNISTIIETEKEVFVSGNNDIPNILNEDNFHLTEQYNSKTIKKWKGVLLDHTLIESLCDKKLYVEIKYYHQKYSHRPLPKYLYKYENVKLECNDCGSSFLLNELEVIEDVDGGYWDNCCPFCGEPDCVEIEYEKIENVKI